LTMNSNYVIVQILNNFILIEANKKYSDKNIERETDGNMQAKEASKPRQSKHISVGEELPPELL